MSTVFPASPSNGDTYIPPQIQKLLASDLANNDNFGWSVALSADGTTALIGAIDEDSGDTDNGAAYVFTRSAGTWTEQAKLLASDRAKDDFFGSSVALSSDGNTALIGAEGKDIFTDKDFGAAYVFTRTAGTWTQQQKLVVLDNNTDEFFGNSVALSSDGNTALIAAEGDDTNRGAAYIFTRSGGTWTEQQRLTAIGRANSDFFGWSVALSADGLTALIGAIGKDTSPNLSNGAAYVFTLTGGVWTQQQELLASDRSSFDNFGISVALSADGLTAIIGASGETTSPTSGQGAAYVFTRSAGTWTEQAKLLASDRATDDDFGYSVAISADGNTVIIGAYTEDTSPNTNNGAAYIFTRSGSTWTQKAKLIASERANSDQFGRSVSLSSDGLTAIVGAWLKDTSPNTDQGAAYIYNFTNTGTRYTYNSSKSRWDIDVYSDIPISLGTSARLLASDAANDDNFGKSVAISADGLTAIVGADREGTSPSVLQGAAYIFTYLAGVWTQQAKLLASDRATGDFFGRSVAISSDGNTVLIGAINEDTSPNTNNGAAYVFTRSGTTWTEQQKLLASDAASSDFFGFSVALSSDGNTAVVGAYGEDTSPNSDNGAVYVYTRSGSTWTEQQKLLASDPAAGDDFGTAVAISADGNTVFVGAPDEDTGGTLNNGAVYVFTRTAGVWTQQQKLLASDPAAGDDFGTAVALSLDGNTLVVGATLTDVGNFSAVGSVYVFTKYENSWLQQSKLDYSRKGQDGVGVFGSSVSVSSDGNIILIGANQYGIYPAALRPGTAFIFTRSGSKWSEQKQIIPSDYYTTAGLIFYGNSVAISPDGSKILIGWYGNSSSTGGVDFYPVNNYSHDPDKYATKAPTTHVFSSSVSDWTVPSGAKALDIVCISGGGGGGSGAKVLSTGTSYVGGGGGGAGGGMAKATINLVGSFLPANDSYLSITVGAGGSGGASASVGGNGSLGSNGGASSVSIYALSGQEYIQVISGEGVGGSRGVRSASVVPAGSTNLSSESMHPGGAGGAGGASGAGGSAGSYFSFNVSNNASAGGAGGGGGGGGGSTIAATTFNGGAGSTSITYGAGQGGTAGSASVGGNAVAPSYLYAPGSGGGGGSSRTGSTGYSGGDGSLYGGGGGGGGSQNSTTGGNSGAGGSGAAGVVLLTVWYE
jgi:hypothetical protein